MKAMILFLSIFILGINSLLYSQSFTGISNSKSSASYRLIEANYLKGLNSDNSGIKASCAYYLGEMKSKKAVTQLMEMFTNSGNKGAKLIAVWSLLKIGEPRGIALVKRYFDSGKRSEISYMLDYLYIDYCLKNKGRVEN